MNPERVKPDPLKAALARLEAKRAKVHAGETLLPSGPKCMRCDDSGWEPVGTVGPVDKRPVRRCRNGCDVPVPAHLRRTNDPRTDAARQDEEF